MGNKHELRDSIDQILEERGGQYGQAWKIAGETIEALHRQGLLNNVLSTPYFHNWVIILSKVIRILASPFNPDHWRDIEGYARLVREDIESEPTLPLPNK